MPTMALPAFEPASGETTDHLGEAISDCKAGRALAPVTVVTPSGYAAVALRRQLACGGPGSGLVNVDFTTVGRVERALAARHVEAEGWRELPAAVELEAIRQVAASGPDPWPRLVDHPRTVGALARAFAELRRWSLPGVEALAARQVRRRDVLLLFLAVRRHLAEHGFADELDIRAAALEATGGELGGVGTGPLVAVGWQHLAPIDRQVLSALGRRLGIRVVGPPAVVPATEVRRCADPDEEARAAVRVVLHGLESGVALWRQAIFHPDGPTYPSLLRQHLDDSQVPLALPERRRLDHTAAGATLLGLLDLPSRDFARHDLAAWLSGGPVVAGDDRRPVPVSLWNAISAEAGVVRGVSQWRTRLDELASSDPRVATEARSLLEFVDDLARRTTAETGSWSERARWAVGLLERYLDPEVGEQWPDEQVLALAQVRAAVLELSDLDALAGAPDNARFRRAVRAQLEGHSVDTSELAGGGVFDGVLVAPFRHGLGLRLHTAVLVGLADAVVPGAGGDDALLPDEVRRMDDSGAVRTKAILQEQLFSDVCTALAAADVNRLVTHPRIDPRTGREHSPSRWLGHLRSSDTADRTVSSFVSGLRRNEPALSVRELRLRSLDASAGRGEELVTSPPVALDPRLRTGIEAVQARATRRFTRYDGNVGPGIVSPFDPLHPVSATRFEIYPQCPRRYLFERVLGISRRPLPEDLWKIEATSRGSVVHAILEQYVLERVHDGAPRSLERLLAIADEHLDRAERSGLVGKALVWRVERTAIVRDLRNLYVEEGDLVPLAAEFSFGPGEEDDSPPVAVTLPDGRVVNFRGRADRVDRDASGDLVVSDYKTGRQTTLSEITEDPLMGGKRLQLPLYGLAARARFGPTDAVHARYWLVSAERSAASYTVDLTDELERHFSAMVGRIATGVGEGLFPAIPGEPREEGFAVCNYCDFDRVCSAVRDRQWAAKRGVPELAPVNELLDSQAPETLLGSVVRVEVPKRVRR